MQTQKFPNNLHIRIQGTNQFLTSEYLYLGLFWSEELIGNDENGIQSHFYFQNGHRQNQQNFNVL
jgi:hypothetical protein